jgi:hypothetical protein
MLVKGEIFYVTDWLTELHLELYAVVVTDEIVMVFKDYLWTYFIHGAYFIHTVLSNGPFNLVMISKVIKIKDIIKDEL